MKCKENLSQFNEMIKKIMVKYGILSALILLIVMILLGIVFLSDRWLEFCSLSVATSSILLTISILFINSKSQEDATRKQIEAFGITTQKQINSFKENTDNQIETANKTTQKMMVGFESDINMVVEKLNDLIKQQAMLLSSLEHTTNTKLEKVVHKMEETNHPGNKATEIVKEKFKKADKNMDRFIDKIYPQIETAVAFFKRK